MAYLTFISLLNKYKQILLVFLLSVAIIQGISFTLMNQYTESMSPDALNYLGTAKGDFDQDPIRKYRVIVPLLAGGLDFFLGGVFEKIRPWSFEGDFSLFVCFWMINTSIMAMFSVITFQLCKNYGISSVAAIAGLGIIYTCRWTAYMAGLPIIDSLFCMVSALALLGIKEKKERLIIFCILIGPWAKESFIFVAPVIFFFSSMHKGKQLAWFLFSGILVFSFRFYLDQYTGTTLADSLQKDLSHLDNFCYAVARLFSFHGLYELFSVTGLWIFIPLYAIIKKVESLRDKWDELDGFMIAYLVCVLMQAIISSELARMLYLALPVLAVSIAFSVDRLMPSLKLIVNEASVSNR